MITYKVTAIIQITLFSGLRSGYIPVVPQAPLKQDEEQPTGIFGGYKTCRDFEDERNHKCVVQYRRGGRLRMHLGRCIGLVRPSEHTTKKKTETDTFRYTMVVPANRRISVLG
jgi:hypothetical protein